MNKEVIISVKGTRADTGNSPDVLEFVTEGKYFKKGNTYYVIYKESEVTGMNGTTTTVKICEGVVTLIRVGSVNTQFIFQEGQKHVSYYDTVHGAFVIGIMAREVNVDVDETGGEIWVDYQLELDNNKMGENDFYMMIREVNDNKGDIYREFLCN